MPAPDNEDCVKSAILEKKIMGRTVGWDKRRVTLMPGFLAIGRPNEDFAINCVLLHEILKVSYVVDHNAQAQHEADRERQAKREGKPVIKHQQSFQRLKSWSDDDYALLITTDPDGTGGGASHILRGTTIEERDSWLEAIQDQTSAAKKAFLAHTERKEATSIWKKTSLMAHRLYISNKWKMLTAIAVLASFAMDIFEAEIKFNDMSESNRDAFEWLVWLAGCLCTMTHHLCLCLT